jgi:biotin operon repressor
MKKERINLDILLKELEDISAPCFRYILLHGFTPLEREVYIYFKSSESEVKSYCKLAKIIGVSRQAIFKTMRMFYFTGILSESEIKAKGCDIDAWKNDNLFGIVKYKRLLYRMAKTKRAYEKYVLRNKKIPSGYWGIVYPQNNRELYDTLRKHGLNKCESDLMLKYADKNATLTKAYVDFFYQFALEKEGKRIDNL